MAREESALATERRLIFLNLMNGVPVESVAKTFHRQTEKEVWDDFRFVALKIKSYAFQRVMPYIPLDNVQEAQANKILIISILGKLNLDVMPVFKTITAQPVEGFLS